MINCRRWRTAMRSLGSCFRTQMWLATPSGLWNYPRRRLRLGILWLPTANTSRSSKTSLMQKRWLRTLLVMRTWKRWPRKSWKSPRLLRKNTKKNWRSSSCQRIQTMTKTSSWKSVVRLAVTKQPSLQVTSWPCTRNSLKAKAGASKSWRLPTMVSAVSRKWWPWFLVSLSTPSSSTNLVPTECSACLWQRARAESIPPPQLS